MAILVDTHLTLRALVEHGRAGKAGCQLVQPRMCAEERFDVAD
jgi:hypothetical protein